jgi:hypothetical protein
MMLYEVRQAIRHYPLTLIYLGAAVVTVGVLWLVGLLP